MLKALGRKKKATGPPRALLGHGAAAAARGGRGAARAPGRRPGLRGGQRAAAQGDRPRPRHHRDGERPGGADRLLHDASVGRRGRREGRDEGDGRLARGLPLRPARRAARVLRQPAPALHRLEGAQRRACARSAVRRGLSISEYGVTEVESGEVFTAATEEELYERLGYEYIPPELRENAGELEAARKGELPVLVESEPAARRPAHALALVGGREEHARRDGPGREGARLRLLRDHRPLALPARGPDGGAGEGDRPRSRSGSRRCAC